MKNNLKIVKYVVLFSIVGYLVFSIADGITGGMITNRYKGETIGTLSGTKDQTFNNITSNRYDIFMGDLELWAQNPVLGVGVGASKYMRSKVNEVIAHVELSRLMAEHGILGGVYFLFLITLGIDVIKKNSRLKILNGYFLTGLFVVALFTTFHAATRTFISPLLFGISILTIKEKNKWINYYKINEKK
jgi:O-antigen ligase